MSSSNPPVTTEMQARIGVAVVVSRANRGPQAFFLVQEEARKHCLRQYFSLNNVLVWGRE